MSGLEGSSGLDLAREVELVANVGQGWESYHTCCLGN